LTFVIFFRIIDGKVKPGTNDRHGISDEGQTMDLPPVILITGASSGIGAATARLFGQSGYRVILAARRQDRLNSLAEEIDKNGGEALVVPTDLCRLDDIQALVARSLEEFAQIDILFNNAGFGRLDWLEYLDPLADIEPQLQTNLHGTIQLTRAVLPHMISRRKGQIIMMGSLASLIGTPTYTIYAASKFGLRGFTQALRREVHIYGIQVSAVYPGGVTTEFNEHAKINRKTGTTTPPGLRLSSEQVAREVQQLTRRPKRSLVLPRVMWVVVWLNRLFPSLVDRMIEARFVIPERM
jgi:short-subunit dehydrogenase